MHEFCIQVLTFDLFLPFTRKELDWVRIWEVGKALLLRHLLEIRLVTLDLIVNQDC